MEIGALLRRRPISPRNAPNFNIISNAKLTLLLQRSHYLHAQFIPTAPAAKQKTFRTATTLTLTPTPTRPASSPAAKHPCDANAASYLYRAQLYTLISNHLSINVLDVFPVYQDIAVLPVFEFCAVHLSIATCSHHALIRSNMPPDELQTACDAADLPRQDEDLSPIATRTLTIMQSYTLRLNHVLQCPASHS